MTTMTLNSDIPRAVRDPAGIIEHFASLSDPRREQGRRHLLEEIIFVAICAILCGADSWLEIADYGESKSDWLKTFLTLPGGVPSHDTFRRVFCLLDPQEFQKCFQNWMTMLMDRHGLIPVPLGPSPLKSVAIDGKTQRGSARRNVGRSPLHMVSAWAVENHVTLGQVATDAKSNEITAIPELLKLLDLDGAVVTIDAMGCQKEIAAGIVREGGEYVLAVKENQPHLSEDVRKAFDEALENGEPGVDFTEFTTETEAEKLDHGRRETRTCCVITNPKGIRDQSLWTGLTAICMVVSQRVVNGVSSSEIRYFIGSAAATAEQYLSWVRGHWGIENSLHWVLDVSFREDEQRHWAGHSAENLSWMRKLALCLLKAEPTNKAKSINRRRHLAGWQNDYLLKVLAQIPEKSGA
jgi:predicted transposase YbfD/YdcC